MIKNISPNQNEIEFEFQEKITGVFFAFGKEYLLNKTNSLKVKNDESLIFDDNYFYIDENKKKHKINFSKFSFNDTSITNPSFRDKGLTHENILFICEKIFKNTKKTLEKCNMLVVMSYRAIDLNNEHYARKTLEDISVFLRELNELIKTPYPLTLKQPFLSLRKTLRTCIYQCATQRFYCQYSLTMKKNSPLI